MKEDAREGAGERVAMGMIAAGTDKSGRRIEVGETGKRETTILVAVMD